MIKTVLKTGNYMLIITTQINEYGLIFFINKILVYASGNLCPI